MQDVSAVRIRLFTLAQSIRQFALICCCYFLKVLDKIRNQVNFMTNWPFTGISKGALLYMACLYLRSEVVHGLASYSKG